jgi:hypothetical protein
LPGLIALNGILALLVFFGEDMRAFGLAALAFAVSKYSQQGSESKNNIASLSGVAQLILASLMAVYALEYFSILNFI